MGGPVGAGTGTGTCTGTRQAAADEVMRIDRRAASECRAMGVGAQEEFLLLPPLRLSHPPSSSPPQTHQSDSAVRPRSPVGHRRRRCLSAAAVKSCPPAGQAVPPTSHDTHARSSKLARQHARRTPPAGALVVGSVGHRRLDLDLGLGMRLFAVGITLSVQSINAHHQACPMSRAPALPPTISLPLPFPLSLLGLLCMFGALFLTRLPACPLF